MSNSTYDINGKTSLILTNPINCSTPRYQSTIINKYENFVPSNLTHPLSTLKQINQILSDQQSNINNKHVSFSLEIKIIFKEEDLLFI
jgi:hypothetical protein